MWKAIGWAFNVRAPSGRSASKVVVVFVVKPHTSLDTVIESQEEHSISITIHYVTLAVFCEIQICC